MTLMSTLAARNKVEYVWRKVCHPIRFGDPHLSRDRPYDFAHDLLSQIGSSAFRFGAGKDPVLGPVVSHLLTPCPQCFRETGVISTSLFPPIPPCLCYSPASSIPRGRSYRQKHRGSSRLSGDPRTPVSPVTESAVLPYRAAARKDGMGAPPDMFSSSFSLCKDSRCSRQYRNYSETGMWELWIRFPAVSSGTR
jgi:hypothetical protein